MLHCQCRRSPDVVFPGTHQARGGRLDWVRPPHSHRRLFRIRRESSECAVRLRESQIVSTNSATKTAASSPASKGAANLGDEALSSGRSEAAQSHLLMDGLPTTLSDEENMALRPRLLLGWVHSLSTELEEGTLLSQQRRSGWVNQAIGQRTSANSRPVRFSEVRNRGQLVPSLGRCSSRESGLGVRSRTVEN